MKTLCWPFLALAVTLSGCNKGTTAPTGQVIATVDGHEITISDLRAEIGDLNPAMNPAARKEIESGALQQIVARYIVADAATEKKLDNTPTAAILKHRGEQQALVELLQRSLRRDVPAPSKEEAQLYAADHPASFAQRRIFLVDQYVARGAPAAVVKQMESLDTLEQIGALLDRYKIPYSKTVGVIDALSVDPDAAEKVANLAQGAVFISPEEDVTRINRIRETQIDPVTGDNAIRIAQDIIQAKRSNELLQRQMGGILQAGLSKVRYNAAYKPAVAAAAAPTSAKQ